MDKKMLSNLNNVFIDAIHFSEALLIQTKYCTMITGYKSTDDVRWA